MLLRRLQLPRLRLLQGTYQKYFRVTQLTRQHRVKKRKRAEPTPRNAFPHVVEKVFLLASSTVLCS